jgi:putative ABC transport system permease protein
LWTETAAPIGVLAKKQIPGVQDVVRITYNSSYGLFKYHDKTFNEQETYFTDASFFSMFDFTIIKGEKTNPFPDNNSIVITKSTAEKYFGNENPVGKIIVADDSINFQVTGVINDFPKNSSIQGKMFFPMSLLAKERYAGNKEGKNIDNDFIQFNYDTYLLLQPGFSFNGFAKKLRDIHLAIKSDDTDIGYVWLPLEKIHLYRSDGSDGGMGIIRIFIVVAILILAIACINYINLSTARAMLRAKEVSLRKIVGAARWQLFTQFIVETMLLFLFAVALALTLVYFLTPLFNQVASKEIKVDLLEPRIWKVILVTIAGTLVVSSIYPAFLLSSFQPIKALKGKISTRISNVAFRKVLVVIQFAFSVILITGTIVIGNQLKYIRSKHLGYDKENVLSLRMINMTPHFDAIKPDLLKQPGISNITWASVNIINYSGQTGDNSWDGKENGETLMLSPMNVDQGFIPFFKMQLLQGSGFTGTTADSMHFILNETAVKAARLKDPVGKRFRLWQTEGTIVGVVKDFHFSSMRQKIQPAIFYCQSKRYGQIYIRTTGKDAAKAIAAVQSQWKRYNQGYSFEYNFLDDRFKRLYESEQRTGLLFDIFAGIAIIISCLGLLGLAAYTAQVRTREIGVRKVVGASVAGIIRLLAFDFIKLVLIAIAIATPASWYFMNKWLQDFAYKINIGWFVFVLAGLLAITIALLTISFQSVKAALANPVKSLRTE